MFSFDDWAKCIVKHSLQHIIVANPVESVDELIERNSWNSLIGFS